MPVFKYRELTRNEKDQGILNCTILLDNGFQCKKQAHKVVTTDPNKPSIAICRNHFMLALTKHDMDALASDKSVDLDAAKTEPKQDTVKQQTVPNSQEGSSQNKVVEDQKKAQTENKPQTGVKEQNPQIATPSPLISPKKEDIKQTTTPQPDPGKNPPPFKPQEPAKKP